MTATTAVTPSSVLARSLIRNPHNFHDSRFGGSLSAHDYAAAQLEADGRKAWPHGSNPYNAGTMANARWAAGWYQMEAADLARGIYERGASRVENRDWRVCEDGSLGLHGGWLVAATYCNPPLPSDYTLRKAFADWYAPAEHRNDGMRTTETAAEKGMREGPGAAADAMREFASLPDLAIRLLEAR